MLYEYGKVNVKVWEKNPAIIIKVKFVNFDFNVVYLKVIIKGTLECLIDVPPAD